MTGLAPRMTLARALEELGGTLLTLVHGDPSEATPLDNVAFHDPMDDAYLPSNSLVLGIGLRGPGDVATLLDLLGGGNAVGLVVRAPVALTPEVVASADRAGLPLVGLAPGASWTQLASMIHALAATDRVGGEQADSLGGVASGDLFALANAIMAIIDAPVTILDRASRVVAFSGRQDEGDASRVETVLGRQVPERFTTAFVERGLFTELYRRDAPVWIEPGPPGTDLPRVAVAVRAGDEVLGSIWAVVRKPLPEDRTRALSDAAKLVALHMLGLRGGSHGAQQLRSDLVSTALAGSPGARDALRRLGLLDEAVVVLAVGVLESGPETVERHARGRAQLQRLTSGLALHLTAVHPRCATALVGDVCYALMPAAGEDTVGAERRAARIAGEFLARASGAEGALVGIGPVCTDPANLVDARTAADRVLRVLLEQGGRHGPVARFEEVHLETLLLDLRDLALSRGDQPSGPMARLLAHDEARGTQLVETLAAWLDAFGDVADASAATFVHPNTFRYRLRKVVQVSGLDLADPDARLAAMLQLRVLLDPAHQPPTPLDA